MPVAEAQRLLPPSPVINVLSACNPTPTLNEARIYHLGRVADVRGLCVGGVKGRRGRKGIQVAGNNILFLALRLTCLTSPKKKLPKEKKIPQRRSVSRTTNFIAGTLGVQRVGRWVDREKRRGPSSVGLLLKSLLKGDVASIKTTVEWET